MWLQVSDFYIHTQYSGKLWAGMSVTSNPRTKVEIRDLWGKLDDWASMSSGFNKRLNLKWNTIMGDIRYECEVSMHTYTCVYSPSHMYSHIHANIYNTCMYIKNKNKRHRTNIWIKPKLMQSSRDVSFLKRHAGLKQI